MSERDEATWRALLFQSWDNMMECLSANDVQCQHLCKIIKSIYGKQRQYKLHECKSAGVNNTLITLKDFMSWFVIDLWTHPTQMMHHGGLDILSAQVEDSQCCGLCTDGAQRRSMKKFRIGLPMRSVRYILITPRPFMQSILVNLLWVELSIKHTRIELVNIIMGYIDGWYHKNI